MYLCLYERGIKSIITTWRAGFRGAAHATAICGAINKRVNAASFADVYLFPLPPFPPRPTSRASFFFPGCRLINSLT